MVMSGLLLLTFLSVIIGVSHIIVTSSLFINLSGTCSIHEFLTVIPRSLSMHQCTYFAIWLCLYMYFVPARILHPDTIWLTVLCCSLHNLHLVSCPLPQVFDFVYFVASACSCAAHNQFSVSNQRYNFLSHCSHLFALMFGVSSLYLQSLPCIFIFSSSLMCSLSISLAVPSFFHL